MDKILLRQMISECRTEVLHLETWDGRKRLEMHLERLTLPLAAV
jgi:hypothetical protein